MWDKLSSEEACLLAAAYYDRPLQDPIAKTQLTKAYPLAGPPEGVRRPYPAEPFPGTMGVYAEGQWVFQGDDNAATHLLRNAMGRGDDWERQRMLSLVGPMARSYRDDTTVMCVDSSRTMLIPAVWSSSTRMAWRSPIALDPHQRLLPDDLQRSAAHATPPCHAFPVT